MPIELSAEDLSEAQYSLKKYVSQELEQDLSDLQARMLLDFIIKEIAPVAYNRGVEDAGNFLRQRLEDLPATCFEPPFGFWRGRRRS